MVGTEAFFNMTFMYFFFPHLAIRIYLNHILQNQEQKS